MPTHPHHETGITDEAAVEAHDIIQHAEEEEEEMHPHQHEGEQGAQKSRGLGSDASQDTQGSSASQEGDQKASGMDKIKEKLHMKK